MMQIVKGTQYWRLLCIVLLFFIFLGAYYFFIVYPKHTEEARLRIAEEIISTFFWIDLSNRDQIYLAIFDQGLELNPVNDEIYIKDLQSLNVLYLQNEDNNLLDVLNQYMQYSHTDIQSVKALCLQLNFIKAYSEKIDQDQYESVRLTNLQKINQRYLSDIQSWLDNLDVFNEFYINQKMIPNCTIQ